MSVSMRILLSFALLVPAQGMQILEDFEGPSWPVGGWVTVATPIGVPTAALAIAQEAVALPVIPDLSVSLSASSTGKIVAGLLLLGTLELSGCDGAPVEPAVREVSSPGAPVAPVSKTGPPPQATRRSDLGRAAPVASFVDVLFEVSPHPLIEGASVNLPHQKLIAGYVLLRVGAKLPSLLYPALGVPPPEAGSVSLWVGTQFVSHFGRPPAVTRGLTAAKGEHHDFTPNRDGDAPPELIPLLPSGALSLQLDEHLNLAITLDGHEQVLQPRQMAVVSSAESELDLGGLATALTGDTELSADWAVARDELASVFGGPESRVYSRLSITFHGPVQVSSQDLVERLQTARRASSEGPYELAEEALELVLEAVPDHGEASDLLARVSQLLDDGREPGRLTGTLVFPAGGPTDDQRALWQRTHQGFATLRRLDSWDWAIQGAAIEEREFSIHLPQGEYQLTVMVPGFPPSMTLVEVEESSKLSVVIEP